jgi:hypothetical protein
MRRISETASRRVSLDPRTAGEDAARGAIAARKASVECTSGIDEALKSEGALERGVGPAARRLAAGLAGRWTPSEGAVRARVPRSRKADVFEWR